MEIIEGIWYLVTTVQSVGNTKHIPSIKPVKLFPDDVSPRRWERGFWRLLCLQNEHNGLEFSQPKEHLIEINPINRSKECIIKLTIAGYMECDGCDAEWRVG